MIKAPIGAAAGCADDAISVATRAAYARAWAHFAAWCRDNGADPGALPNTPALVAAYLAALAATHGASALRSRVAAIACHHRQRGVAFAPTHSVIRETLGAIRGRHPRPVRPAAALASPEVKRLLAACPGDLAGLRDQALLLVGFAGAFRRSELVAIDREHLRFAASGVTIHVPRGKRGQEGEGAGVTLPRLRDASTGVVSDTCPVRALEAWLARAQLRRGPVFRGVNRHGAMEDRLTPGAVRLILLKRAGLAKLTAPAGERLSPQGLRAGSITQATLAGLLDQPMGELARHDDPRPTRDRRRRTRITGDNPARPVDL